MVNINSLERDGLRQAEFCPRHTMKMKTKNILIPDRSQPGITMTAPTVRHRDVGDKYATGVPEIKKIRGRENITVGTWNVRTLRTPLALTNHPEDGHGTAQMGNTTTRLITSW